jgi:hypothetical protein
LAIAPNWQVCGKLSRGFADRFVASDIGRGPRRAVSDDDLQADAPWTGALERATARFGARARSSLHAMAGKQIGDPDRAAQAILELVRAGEPPTHLLLGTDALRRAREKLDAVVEEMDRWEEVTRGADFPQVEPVRTAARGR